MHLIQLRFSSKYALLLYALCSMLYALCSMLYALCSMLYALCSMLYALCSMPYALCSMPYALCPILYALSSVPCYANGRAFWMALQTAKTLMLLLLGSAGKMKKTQPVEVVAQCGSHDHFAVREGDRHFLARRFLAVEIMLSLDIPGIADKISNHEHRFEIRHGDLQRFGGKAFGRKEMETVFVRKEIMGEPLEDPPVHIPRNHFHRFHASSQAICPRLSFSSVDLEEARSLLHGPPQQAPRPPVNPITGDRP